LRINSGEDTITRDIVQGIKAGRFTLGGIYKPAGYVNIDGYSVGYDGRYMPTFFAVSTYYVA